MTCPGFSEYPVKRHLSQIRRSKSSGLTFELGGKPSSPSNDVPSRRLSHPAAADPRKVDVIKTPHSSSSIIFVSR